MKRVSASLMLSVPDDAELDQLQAKARQLLDEDPSVEVVAASAAIEDATFTVYGTTRGKPDDRQQVTVFAQSEDEAEAKATEENPKLAVAYVERGEASAAPA